MRMGREKTILLGLLGLLAGVFVGALSLKLLVPRPPTGTGPDIRADVAAVTAQERVTPPVPSPAAWDFSAAPPLVPDDAPAATEPMTAVTEPSRFSRFGAPPIDESASDAVVPPASRSDEGVAPASWQQADAPDEPPPADAIPTAPPRFGATPPARFDPPDPPPAAAPTPLDPGPPTRDPFVVPASAELSPPVAGDYLVRPGDSWWQLAERAYGDGRLYRALFAWNRARDPRVTLAPGTQLEVPPLDRLQAAWPRLTAPR